MTSKLEKARAKLAADPLPESQYLQVGDDQILIKCGFSESLLQLLRWVPKLEWRPELRGWTVPMTAAETLRGILPEVLRLAEASTAHEPDPNLSAEDHFKMAGRLLFGSDWQRETARALGRDETALARFLLGERSAEDSDQLYADMVAFMQQRANDITAAAERFKRMLQKQKNGETEAPQSDQGM